MPAMLRYAIIFTFFAAVIAAAAAKDDAADDIWRGVIAADIV